MHISTPYTECLDKCSKDYFSALDTANTKHQLRIKTSLYITGLKPILSKQKQYHKDIFACLFSIHNTISLSCHEQVCLSGPLKRTCSLHDKLIVLKSNINTSYHFPYRFIVFVLFPNSFDFTA